MKKIPFLFSLVFCIACGEKQQEESAPVSTGMSEPIQVQTKRSVILLPEAEKEVSEWLAYATAQNEIENIKSATGEELMENSQPLVQIMESLQNSLPDTLKVKAVEARTNVLVTKAKTLHQHSTKRTRNPEDIFQAGNDLIVEFDNFKIQLNELFLKSPSDFELELDREFEESQDSLRELPREGSK